jgi:hypothetical protein
MLNPLFGRKEGMPVGGLQNGVSGYFFFSPKSFWIVIALFITSAGFLSTAYHPQTNSQTEHTNQTLEQYLCCYVNYQQNNWSEFFPIAKFTYNNTVKSGMC